MKKVKKLILPVAGRGSRLKPLTNHRPKALLKISEKALIDYVLEEAKLAGIKEIILIVRPSQKKKFQAHLNKKIFSEFKFFYREQEKLLGNGHSILMAEDLIANEPVAVRFPDDLLIGKNNQSSSLRQAIEIFQSQKSPILMLKKVPQKDVFRYGIVKLKNKNLNIKEINDIVEKPDISKAPSNLAVLGLYILTPKIIKYLKDLSASIPEIDDALPLTSALKMHLEKNGKIFGIEVSENHFDCGNMEGFLKARNFLAKKL